MTRLEFGRIEADGTHVVLHCKVTVAGLIEHPFAVRFTEERAHRLVAEFHAAIAKLGRTRLAR